MSGLAREIALQIMVRQPLVCVWSGKALKPDLMDVDHCFPWTAWPCDDLWNLMPAHRSINQHEKSAKLPSAARLGQARERILNWWSDGYFSGGNREIRKRFVTEAQVSLPTVSSDPELDHVFEGVELQRLRIHYDQQVPEWG